MQEVLKLQAMQGNLEQKIGLGFTTVTVTVFLSTLSYSC